MNIQGAVFDLDGTLIDSLTFWDYCWKKLGETFQNDPSFRPDDETDKEIRTMILADAMLYIKKACSLEIDDRELIRFAEDAVIDFYTNHVSAKPGVIEFLAYLKAHNVRLCVASATAPRFIKIALQNCGLTPYLDTIVSCEDVGKGKEHPDVYFKALEQIGTTPEDTWIFEDSFIALETAASIGMYTVGIYDPNNYEQQRLKNASRIYLGPGQTMADLIDPDR